MTTTPNPPRSRLRLAIFLMMGISLGLSLKYGQYWKKEVMYYATDRAALTAVQRSCKGDEKCFAEMTKAAPLCARLAVESPNAGSQGMDQSVLVSCLQKKFYRQACKGETRCVANIDNSYDRCYARAYPLTVSPEDVTAAEELAICLRAAD